MDSSFETTVILTDPQYQMYRIEYEYNMQYHIIFCLTEYPIAVGILFV